MERRYSCCVCVKQPWKQPWTLLSGVTRCLFDAHQDCPNNERLFGLRVRLCRLGLARIVRGLARVTMKTFSVHGYLRLLQTRDCDPTATRRCLALRGARVPGKSRDCDSRSVAMLAGNYHRTTIVMNPQILSRRYKRPDAVNAFCKALR